MRFLLCCRHPASVVVRAVFCLSICGVLGQPVPALFFDDGGSVAALHQRAYSTEDSVRSRLAGVDTAVFSQLESGDEVLCRLNLFAGTEHLVTLRKGETSDDDYGVHAGTIVGEPNSQVMLVTRGELVAGSVLIPGQAAFQIVPQGRGVCLLKELRLPALRPCGWQILDESHRPMFRPELSAQGRALDSGVHHALGSVATGTEPREIEVMMLYTPAAKDAISGSGAMEALARLSVEEANAAMTNSVGGVRFRVVHIGEIEYAESGDLGQDLDRLRSTSDGILDEAHALRDQHQADLVCLMVGRSHTYGGLAHGATGPQDGFSVVNVHLPGLVAHEFGHNLGCDHDRENASGNGAFSFSYGHRLVLDGVTYRTVMSYAPGWPIPHYSNPDVTFRGVPTGVPTGEPDEADNARTIRAKAAFVDSYRGVRVDLVRPSEGGSFGAAEVIELAAVVRSDEGLVEGVEFLSGELVLGEVGTAPYEFSWINPPAGRHVISARARVSGDVVQQSKSIVVAVTPANDNFIDRLPVSGSNVIANTVLYAASSEPGEPAGADAPAATAWWSWTAPADGMVRVSTSGPRTARARAAVFSGRTLPELKPVPTTGALSTDVLFYATAHEEYQICLAGEPSTETIFLYVTMQTPPRNDDFANAERLDFLSGTIRGSTVAATAEAGEPFIGSRPSGHSIWFVWSPSASGYASFTHTLGKAETDFAVYSGTNLTSLRLVASSSLADRGFPVQAKETYYIAVDGAFQTISLVLNFRNLAVNDNFSKRTSFNGAGGNLFVSPGSREPGEPAHGATRGGHSQWWNWRAPSNGGVRISRNFNPSTYPDLSMAWYTGTALTNLLRIDSCDFTNSFQESFTVPVRGGTNYIIALESGDGVNQSVRFEFRSAALNDHFRQRQAVATNLAHSKATGTTLGATAEKGERAHGGLTAAHSAWWSWATPTNRIVSLTVDSTGDVLPRLAVYTGESLTNLSLVTENRADGEIGPSVSFAAEAGRRYAFAVDESISSFSYSLLLSNAVVPANNDFELARLLPVNAQLISGSTIAATLQPDEPQHFSPEITGSVWYSWSALSETEVTVLAGGRRAQTETELKAVLPEPIVAVYQGTNLANLTPVSAGVGAATFRPGRNVKYRIAVASPAAQQNFFLSVVPLPRNDWFENALPLSDGGVSGAVYPTILRSATKQPGEPDHGGGASGHSLWWTWVPRRSGDYMWTTHQLAGLNTRPVALVMAVYTGTKMTNLSLVASTLSDGLNFAAQAGRRYYLALDLKDPRVPLSQTTTFGGLSLRLSRYPTLLAPRLLPGQGIEFVIAGSVGQTVALETSDDLVRWEVLREPVLQSSDYRHMEPDWPMLPQKFFRVLLK